MKTKKPPSRPRKFRRKGSDRYYCVYWEDKTNDAGEVIGRRQVQVPLNDEDGQKITAPRKAEAACDRLYESLTEKWRKVADGATLLSIYLDSYLSAATRRAGTRRSYETKLTQFREFLEGHGVRSFSELERGHIKQFLDHRLEDVKLVTVYGDLRAIRAFLNEAVKDGQVAKSPCTKITLPSLKGAHRSEGFFLPQEMDAIVQHCEKHDPDWYPIFAGFRYAPFRREELCFLEWSDVDLDRDLIVIQDEKKSYGWKPKRDGRTMDLHPQLKRIITSRKAASDFVFQHPDKVKYENVLTERHELGRRAWRKIKTLCDELELADRDETKSWARRFPNGPHLKAFRSGVSCELQLKGAPLAYVQSQLGHRDQSITLEHYTHLVPELMGSLTKRFVAYLGNTEKAQQDPSKPPLPLVDQAATVLDHLTHLLDPI